MTTPSEDYISYICSLYNDKYDDRIEDSKPSGEDWLPGTQAIHKSLITFQRELEEQGVRLSTSKIKKILITGGVWTTERSREIAELYEEYTATGLDAAAAVKAIAEELEVSVVTVNTNLPYSEVVYNLEEKSANARRCDLYRERHKNKTELWKAIIELEGQSFTTFGRGSRPGISFSYVISRASEKGGGRRYAGESVPGYGNELWIVGEDGVRHKKSISRSTVELGYGRAMEKDGDVPGPKALGTPGAGSYLYAIFREMGVIKKAGEV